MLPANRIAVTRPVLWLALLASAALLPLQSLAAERVTGAQRRAVELYLDAVASGSPQAVAMAIHPDDIEGLRTRLLTLMREEAATGDSTIRSRLFGPAARLEDLERLTAINFYATLSRKLYLRGRAYRDAKYLGAVADKDNIVHVVLRAEQIKDRGDVQVVNVVSIKPWGKDWKAILPSEIEAQIDDLMHARRPIHGPVVQTSSAGGQEGPGSGGAATPSVPPGITTLLEAAEKSLDAGDCEAYYEEHMSPNFRRVTSKKALEMLVNACKNSMGTREMLSTTIRLVRGLSPSFQYQGRRAVYDLSGQGLPFERFVLEEVNKRWYIAE